MVAKKEKVVLICQNCKEKFEVHPYREKTAKFCSHVCRAEWQNKYNPKVGFKEGHKIIAWNKDLKGWMKNYENVGFQKGHPNYLIKHTEKTKEILRQKALKRLKDGLPEKTKKKIGNTLRRRHASGEIHIWCEGTKGLVVAWSKNLTVKTDERVKQQNESHLEYLEKNPKAKEEMTERLKPYRYKKGDERITGKNNPNWKNGITPLTHLIRNIPEFIIWRDAVFEKDNYICQKSGKRSGKNKVVFLEAHHKKSFNTIVAECQIKSLEDARNCKALWDVNNGITFSRDCHLEFHNKYGRGNNTIEQLKEFLIIV